MQQPAGVPRAPAGSESSAGPLESASPILTVMVVAYLAVLPFGQLLVIPVAGANATLSDAVLALMLLAALVDVGRGGLPWYGGRFQIAVVLFLLFALWAGFTGVWGFHSDYAVAKGVAYGGLALGVFSIGSSGLDWQRATDAWLLGAGVALAVVLVGVLAGPEGLRDRVLYGGGSVLGLPLPRVTGPFYHPNLFGSYLMVSGALLWSSWDGLVARARWAAWALAVGIGVGLFFTASTAWLGAGLLLVGWGRWMAAGDGRSRVLSWTLRLGGGALAAVTLAGLLVSVEVEVGPWTVVTSGIRPEIWRSAFQAILDAPVLGVGAAPYLAEATDPLLPARGPALWDAHSIYLSVWGQFGAVGFLLLAGAVGFVVGDVAHLPRGRVRAALLAILLAAGANGIANASEDFRHLWAVLGLMGVACLTMRAERLVGEGESA